jgi:hypothetical protein
MRTSLYDSNLLSLLEQGFFGELSRSTGGFDPPLERAARETPVSQSLRHFPVFRQNRAFSRREQEPSFTGSGAFVGKTGDVSGSW